MKFIINFILISKLFSCHNSKATSVEKALLAKCLLFNQNIKCVKFVLHENVQKQKTALFSMANLFFIH